MPTDTRIIPCKLCGNHIADPDLQVLLYQEEYPDIKIGPYCEGCLAKIKICNGCKHGFESSHCTRATDGAYYCRACSASFTKCSSCDSIVSSVSSTTKRDKDGNILCDRCFSAKYTTCRCCEGVTSKDDIVNPISSEGMSRAGIFKKYSAICKTCFEVKKKHFKLYAIRVCKYCERSYKETDGNENYCDRCLSEFRTCGCCDTKKPNIKNVLLVTYGESHKNFIRSSINLCPDCSRTKYSHCDSCGIYVKNDNASMVKRNKTLLCPGCATKEECKNCGVFSNKLSKDKKWCHECEVIFGKDNVCSDCGTLKDFQGNCRICGHTNIYSYSTKPKLFFNMSEKEIKENNIFFGFENEVTFGRDSHSVRDQALSHLYQNYSPSVLMAKSDGSINGSGYEIVSMPMTYKFFKDLNLAPMFSEKMKKDTSCGLHVHVARNSFLSDVHLYKVINFLKDNPKFAIHFAGRDYNSYSTKVDIKATTYLKSAKGGRTERRCSVNLTNKTTVEFRMFAGCINESDFRSRIEALHALVLWTRDEGISKIKLDNYLKFINDNAEEYPNASVLVSKFKRN